ncbi:hypothetical protein MCOR02_007493 [Pyricularia oryzae]|nr:hypothetical protein MCOR02_007493 [Pyricularia oryzae]
MFSDLGFLCGIANTIKQAETAAAAATAGAAAGATTQSRKRRREEEENEEEGEGCPRRSSRPSRHRRVRPDGLIPRQVICFGCARAFLAGTATGYCADQPGARCWNCRGGHTCLSLPIGGPLKRAAGELGHALLCLPRVFAKEVQLFGNVVTYHFRDWTESQTKELAAFQPRRTPAPEPVIGASGVPVVPLRAFILCRSLAALAPASN